MALTKFCRKKKKQQQYNNHQHNWSRGPASFIGFVSVKPRAQYILNFMLCQLRSTLNINVFTIHINKIKIVVGWFSIFCVIEEVEF